MGRKLPKRTSKGFRLDPAVAELLRDLAAKMGLSETAVVEQAVRTLAKREGVGS